MSKRIVYEKAENIESFKRDSLIIGENVVPKDNVAMQGNGKGKSLPATEETYLQQSKRSIYYKKAKSIMQNLKILTIHLKSALFHHNLLTNLAF